MTRHQQPRRRMLLVALAFLLALVGSGLTPGPSAGAASTSAVAVVHQAVAVVHPATLPKLTAAGLSGHPGHSGAASVPPPATTGSALVLALLALAVVRRAGTGPAPVSANVRRLPPGRAPPALTFTR
jgi:hypothetical protein